MVLFRIMRKAEKDLPPTESRHMSIVKLLAQPDRDMPVMCVNICKNIDNSVSDIKMV